MIHFNIPRLHYALFTKISIEADISVHNNEHYLNDIADNSYIPSNTNLKENDRLLVTKSNEISIHIQSAVNPYQYLYSFLPGKEFAVSLVMKASSYYTMVEIIRKFIPIESYEDIRIKTLHLTEDAVSHVEALNKDILTEQVVITDMGTLEHFIAHQKYQSSIDFITLGNQADTLRELYEKVCYAICLQKKGGHLIVKMQDITSKGSIDIIGLLSSLYTTTSVTKPCTSISYLSDVYIVCLEYRPNYYLTMYPYIHASLKTLFENTWKTLSFFQTPLSIFFQDKLKESTVIIHQHQIESNHTISNIHYIIHTQNGQAAIQSLIKLNTLKCISWCSTHDIEMNRVF